MLPFRSACFALGALIVLLAGCEKAPIDSNTADQLTVPVGRFEAQPAPVVPAPAPAPVASATPTPEAVAPAPEASAAPAPESSATALGGEDLAKAKNCLSCHKIDAKLIGPGYKEVAAKYAGQHDAVAHLADKVMKGGGGVWGPVPMSPNPQVSHAEAEKLVTWVLSLK
jgi:cytochrome c